MRYPEKVMISSNVVKDSLVSLLVVLLSMWVGQFYTEGDQMHYMAAYEALVNSELFNGFWIYKSHITTEEPIHFFITWIFSSVFGANKLFVMSLSNGLLAYLVIRVVRKNGGVPSVAYTLVLTNYYFFVVYLTAERLKFAFIFFLVALLSLNRPKSQCLLFLLSVLSHMQMLIILVAGVFRRVVTVILQALHRHSIGKSIIVYLIGLIFALGVFLYFFGAYLMYKVPQYMHGGGVASIWQAMIFMLLTLVYIRNGVEIFLFFIPIVVASLVVGPERVVILAYFVFVYYSVQYKGGLNYGIGFTTLYFGIKAVGFLVNIFNTGQGF